MNYPMYEGRGLSLLLNLPVPWPPAVYRGPRRSLSVGLMKYFIEYCSWHAKICVEREKSRLAEKARLEKPIHEAAAHIQALGQKRADRLQSQIEII